METLLTVVHVIACVLMVLLVLLQSGKGAEVSASFGGSSQTIFGASGGANFFTRFTAVVATIFMITSIGLTMQHSQSKKSVFAGSSTPLVEEKAPSQEADSAAPLEEEVTPAQE